MTAKHTLGQGTASLSRRRFLKYGAATSAAVTAGPALSAPAKQAKRPNFLFIITDQQGLDTLSSYGCPGIRTPHLDRLAARGVSFMESHSTNPVCSPARSSLFTGRTASETGVIKNGLAIRQDVPNMGQWLGKRGYDPVYVGKWHVPQSYTVHIPGFTVIPAGNNGAGTLLDRSVSRGCQGFLHNRGNEGNPFLLVASFLQPHDICQWTSMHKTAPDVLPFPQIADELPPLPPNFAFDPREPQKVAKQRARQKTNWSKQQWRYYIWAYYRMVEEVDAEIGRVLQALEDSGQAENTVVIFTSDHGEGRGRHQMIVKNYLYEEAVKVPLIVSCPGRIPEGVKDTTHLVTGNDIMRTVCDYAGVEPPEGVYGGDLRPLLEGRNTEWREFALAEVNLSGPQPGYMLRTPDHKYITYHGDPVEQLFDMRSDPGETKNLAGEARHADTLNAHRKLLREQWARLDFAPNAPKPGQPG
ncbi:MAG: sulfatase-like hydrolase/transferase [Victivallales bacterium]|jgi:arylsulfatase A-like enzyme|nr:sulfatase-like hydrolase/transferase [Victivallales bacterium]